MEQQSISISKAGIVTSLQAGRGINRFAVYTHLHPNVVRPCPGNEARYHPDLSVPVYP
jgi:hypothetical protein